MEKENTIDITNGPSREELFDGLCFYSEKRFIPFLLKKNGKDKYSAVLIESIEAEDGSGHSWNLTVSVNKNQLTDEFFNHTPKQESGVIAKKIDFNFFKQLVEERYPMPDLEKDMVRVKIYYSTKNRTGKLVLPLNLL